MTTMIVLFGIVMIALCVQAIQIYSLTVEVEDLQDRVKDLENKNE